MALIFFFFSLMAVQVPQHHLLKGHLSYTVLHVHLCAKKKKTQQIWYICVCLDSSMISLITCKQKCLFLPFLCMCAQSCWTLCNPMDWKLPSSFVHGVSQERILEWVTFPPPGDSSRARDWTQDSCTSCIGSGVLNHCATWEGPSFAMCKHKDVLAEENSLKKWTA